MAEERELKLAVPDHFAMPPLDDRDVHPQDRGVRQLEATYWDTEHLDLYRAGTGLRHRLRDGRDGMWTLKRGGRRDGATVVRTEIEVRGDADAIPRELVLELPQGVSVLSLHPTVRLSTRRHVIDLLDDAGQRWGELADDVVSVLDGPAVVERCHEVEGEIAGPVPDEVVGRVVRRLREAGAHDAAWGSKHEHALRALGLLRET